MEAISARVGVKILVAPVAVEGIWVSGGVGCNQCVIFRAISATNRMHPDSESSLYFMHQFEPIVVSVDPSSLRRR